MKRFLSLVMMVVLSMVLGCGGKSTTTEDLLNRKADAGATCKFPSESYVASYTETEGSCGPQEDELVTPKAPIERPNCQRNTYFDIKTCQYVFGETCKNWLASSPEAPDVSQYRMTTNYYEMTLVGESGGTGTLTRTIVENDVEVCKSTYAVTWM